MVRAATSRERWVWSRAADRHRRAEYQSVRSLARCECWVSARALAGGNGRHTSGSGRWLVRALIECAGG